VKRIIYQDISYQKKEHVAIININAHAKDQEELAYLANELSNVCSEITSDKEMWVIAVTGAGGEVFSMGEELIAEILKAKEGVGIRLSSIAEPIAKLDRPIIVGISGDAIGQGLELALACDIRIAAKNSHFGLPHIKTGLIPWDGGVQRLSRLVGRGKAMEMILTGEVIDAHEAFRIGLVNKVVPAEELSTVVIDMAREIASRGPVALRYAKEAIYKGMDLTLDQGLRLEADLYFLLHTTRDRTEGIEAFREKRAPRFKGR